MVNYILGAIIVLVLISVVLVAYSIKANKSKPARGYFGEKGKKLGKGEYIALGVAMGISIGAGLGIAIGVIMDNIAIGVAMGPGIGVSVGVSIGAALENKYNGGEAIKNKPSSKATKVMLALLFTGLVIAALVFMLVVD